MDTKTTLKQLYAVWKPFRGLALLAVILTGVSEAFSLISPYLYGRLVDGLVGQAGMDEIFRLIGIIFAFIICGSLPIGFLTNLVQFRFIQIPLERHVSAMTLEGLMKFSIGQHLNENSGIKHSTVTRGESALNSLFIITVYNLVPTLLQSLVTVIFLFIIAPIIGAIVLAGVLVYVIAAVITNRRFKKSLEVNYKNRRENDNLRHEILRNLPLIKMNAREKLTCDEFKKDLHATTEYSKRMWVRYMIGSYSRDIIVITTRVLVMLVGAYMVYRGTYTVGFLLIIFSWSATAFDRIGWIAKQQRELLENWTRAKAYFKMLGLEPGVKMSDNSVKLNAVRGAIDIKSLWFKYPDNPSDGDSADDKASANPVQNDFVLRNVNLRIEPGEVVAIVGPSGAGKSTLISMLLRAYDPDHGEILIDGHNLRDLDLKQYHEALGVVPQDVLMFDNSLRYNILIGMNGYAKSVTDSELDKIAKISCIDRFFDRLTDGYDTMIGERGVKLSGGERQRVAIARALMKKPHALIFDEATSSLDTENEALIRESIRKASRGKTSIIIAHRFSTVKVADRIIVMDHGQIVGQGAHDDLCEGCDVYRRLIENQTVMLGG